MFLVTSDVLPAFFGSNLLRNGGKNAPVPDKNKSHNATSYYSDVE